MTNREKGMTKIQKCEYLENKSSFLDEIKSIFYIYLRAIIWQKITKNEKHAIKNKKKRKTINKRNKRRKKKEKNKKKRIKRQK